MYATDEELIAAALSGGQPAFDGVAETVERQGWARLNLPTAPFADGFPTPDGRASLWPLATASSAERDGGLRLLAVPGRHFVNTLFANSDAHRARRGELTVSLHTDDAQARGVSDGAIVRIANARGSFTARASVGDGVRPGVAALPKGSWPKLEGGVTANWTTREGDADFGRGAVFHDNIVEITPV